jgi:hypothetical protein
MLLNDNEPEINEDEEEEVKDSSEDSQSGAEGTVDDNWTKKEDPVDVDSVDIDREAAMKVDCRGVQLQQIGEAIQRDGKPFESHHARSGA